MLKKMNREQQVVFTKQKPVRYFCTILRFPNPLFSDMAYSDTTYFLLFANCIPVKGATRSIIYDVQRNNFEFIPNELYSILTRCSKKTIGEIKDLFNRNYDEIIDEYFEFLVQNEFLIFVDELDAGFTKFNSQFDVPNAVTNCIIDFDAQSDHPLDEIKQQLDALICQSLQLRYYDPVSLQTLDDHLLQFEDSRLRSIEILLPFIQELTEDVLVQLNKKYPRLLTVMLFNAPENEQKQPEASNVKIYYSRSAFQSEQCCGNIHSMFFRVNIRAFSEAKQFNSCLNKKISIDKRGKIRNCPSMKNSFGKIQTNTLEKALLHPDFKSTWGITKDKVKTCKVCEFRYMCSDCRAYTEDPEDNYSKPLKCGYNPYTAVWEEWSSNPLKQAAIRYYGLKETEIPLPAEVIPSNR
jgi:SPASM domain peptide maturase of grasp-with-spasm system